MQITACKISEDGRALIVRIFEPTGEPRHTTLRVPALSVETDLTLGAFEIRTLSINLATGFVSETDLMERRKA